MAKTVVGMFKSTTEAQRVKEQLVAQGFESRNITVMAQNEYSEDTIHNDDDFAYDPGDATEVHTGFDGGYGITGESVSGTGLSSKTQSGTGLYAGKDVRRDAEAEYDTDTRASDRTGTTHEGVGEKISNFFKSLVGDVDEDTTDRGHHHYQQGVTQGGALLAATVQDDRADEVAELLRDNGARNVDEETISDSGTETPYAGATAAGTNYSGTDYDAPAARDRGIADAGRGMTEARGMTDGERAIPVVKEDLQIGKRTVNRGGVRIYSHMVERPVSEDITLREEHVRVDRRPVDREATAADFNQKDQTIELKEMSEEPVIGKTRRVVEEVVVSKEASERTQTVQDTVRNTEVEVEKIAGEDRLGTDRTVPETARTGNR